MRQRMMDTARRNGRGFYGSIAAKTVLVMAALIGVPFATAGTGSASTSTGPLDIAAYCSTHQPYQSPENPLQVFSKGYRGDAHKNNWACRYDVFHVVPLVGYGGEIGGIPFPVPTTEYFPIDFNGMCKEQFPGTHAKWIPAPATGYSGEPWGCVR